MKNKHSRDEQLFLFFFKTIEHNKTGIPFGQINLNALLGIN
jgi:hypothetical protein